MTEKIIVLVIIALAAAYLGHRFLAKKNRGKCACGCDGCDTKAWNAAGKKSSI